MNRHICSVFHNFSVEVEIAKHVNYFSLKKIKTVLYIVNSNIVSTFFGY